MKIECALACRQAPELSEEAGATASDHAVWLSALATPVKNLAYS